MMKNSTALRSFVLILYVLFAGTSAIYGQFLKPFEVRYENRIRGNMTMISNNVISRESGWRGGPNDPYNGNDNNDGFNMQYIDVDGNNSTFSSSRATLAITDSDDCYKILYAGLYWAGTYPSETSSDNTRRRIDQVKLQLPGSSGYLDLTGKLFSMDITLRVLMKITDLMPVL